MTPKPIPPPELRQRMVRARAVAVQDGTPVDLDVANLIAHAAPSIKEIRTTTRHVLDTCKKRGIIVDYVNVKRVLRGYSASS